jgi:ABC-2 type transport system ATP-binding protein
VPGSLVGGHIRTTERTSPDERLALRAAGLTKRYGRLTALDDLTIDVTAGEVFGFLGPNGAVQIHHHPPAARPRPPDSGPGLGIRCRHAADVARAHRLLA